MKDYRRPAYLRAQPKRMESYSLYRERDFTEPNWVRIPDLKDITLPRPVVLINGAFDILTSSHMRMIFAARHKAATLICALDGDEKIASEKGPERPILNLIERLTTLNFMPIDYTCIIDTKKDMDLLIANTSPDLRVQGEDYLGKPTRYPSIPRVLVREGKIHTSTIVERILAKYDPDRINS